jgi:hypothetical protein
MDSVIARELAKSENSHDRARQHRDTKDGGIILPR